MPFDASRFLIPFDATGYRNAKEKNYEFFFHFLNHGRVIFQGEKKVISCHLRYVSGPIDLRRHGSLVTVEYGFMDFCQDQCFYRVRYFKPETSIVSIGNERKYSRVERTSSNRPWSQFVDQSAQLLKRNCTKLKSLDKDSGFKLVHLRGTDRPCGLQSYTPQTLVNKLTSKYNLDPNEDLVYLMTDLNNTDSFVKALLSAFNLCQAPDIELFREEPFLSSSYAMFAVELALQNRCDGFVETFQDHGESKSANFLGSLAPSNCPSLHKPGSMSI